jgi:hypothetical protein
VIKYENNISFKIPQNKDRDEIEVTHNLITGELPSQADRRCLACAYGCTTYTISSAC